MSEDGRPATPQKPRRRARGSVPALVWDPGLQPERTRLAWQRTSLGLLSASLIVARFVGQHAIGTGIGIAALACLLAGGIGILSTRRYHSVHQRLDNKRPLQGGVVNLLLTLAFLVVAVGAIIYVLI